MALVVPFHADQVEAVVPQLRALLSADGIVALPTDTYYGLAVDPFRERAVRGLLTVKGRAPEKAILLLIGERAHLQDLAAQVPPAAVFLMDRFWPGPLTIVLPATTTLSPLLTAGTGTIGVRCPSPAPLRALLTAVGPVTGTSANRSSEPSLDRADAVQERLGSSLDLILDGGATPGGPASTVLDACGAVRLLRAGAVPTETIRLALAEAGYALSS